MTSPLYRSGTVVSLFFVLLYSEGWLWCRYSSLPPRDHTTLSECTVSGLSTAAVGEGSLLLLHFRMAAEVPYVRTHTSSPIRGLSVHMLSIAVAA
jgi:hypothetical protein